MDRSQDYTNAEADTAGALTDCREGKVRGAVVRPNGAEVMLRKPNARKALLFGEGNLFQRFVDALGFAGCGPGFGDLNLIVQANSHGTVSSEVPEIATATRIPQVIEAIIRHGGDLTGKWDADAIGT
jgi:hypothetical protein